MFMCPRDRNAYNSFMIEGQGNDAMQKQYLFSLIKLRQQRDLFELNVQINIKIVMNKQPIINKQLQK